MIIAHLSDGITDLRCGFEIGSVGDEFRVRYREGHLVSGEFRMSATLRQNSAALKVLAHVRRYAMAEVRGRRRLIALGKAS